MKEPILCSISTRGRYDTTLALAIQAVINQSRPVDKLIIYDDNDNPKDLREIQHYQYLFQILDAKKIQWEVQFAEKKGQHYNHQKANHAGYTWVWRIDDDCVPEYNVLENLMVHATPQIGAIGGAILTPPVFPNTQQVTGLIDRIYDEPNIQWDYIKQAQRVDHLHCSFVYRAGIHDYDLNLSRVAHREETLFTYGLRQKGYEIVVVPNAVTWHLKNKEGGIRTGTEDMFNHDEKIFQNYMQFKDKTIVVLDNGMGDHLVFKKILPEIKNPVLFTCYPEIIPGRSIQEARDLFGNTDQWNIYMKMDNWHWNQSLEKAFRKLYLEKK